MRGESLEPGGCSATPTSWETRLTIACPAPEAGCEAAVPVSDDVPAFCSAVEKVVGAVVEGVATGGAAAAGAAKSDCSCATRARATSKLMHELLRHPSRRT